MNFIFNLIGLLNSDIFVKTEHKRKKRTILNGLYSCFYAFLQKIVSLQRFKKLNTVRNGNKQNVYNVKT